MADGVWVTDEELIARSGVPEKIMRDVLTELDRRRDSGFPKKQALYGNRRYWPAVQEYWSTINRIPRGRDHGSQDRERARNRMAS